jgi:cyclophilin family peptidyl-prolyl cis-trans isomerase
MRFGLALLAFATITAPLTAAEAPPAAAPAPATTAPTETPAPKGVIVLIETSMGPIKLELDREKAPITVENFLKYVRSGHYDGTIFHRVIPGFMIQGGGMNVSMIEKPTRPAIKNEHGNGLTNTRGTIAMARTSDPNSATSQFFINVVDNQRGLDAGDGYAVFGKVLEGMDVADKISLVRTSADVPKTPITIEKVRVLFDPKPPAPAAATAAPKSAAPKSKPKSAAPKAKVPAK